MCCTVHIPPELTDQMIDFLWDDVSTLANCALTCKTWYPASLYHLRRNLVVRSASGLRRAAQGLISPSSRPQYASVEMLHVHEDSQRPFFHNLPLFIHGPFLPALRTVILHDVDWLTYRHPRPHPTHFHLKLSWFTSVTTVVFRNCRFRDLTELLCVVRSFPRLRALGKLPALQDDALIATLMAHGTFDITFKSPQGGCDTVSIVHPSFHPFKACTTSPRATTFHFAYVMVLVELPITSEYDIPYGILPAAAAELDRSLYIGFLSERQLAAIPQTLALRTKLDRRKHTTLCGLLFIRLAPKR